MAAPKSEKRQVQEKATARWVKVSTCNACKSTSPFKCSYQKTVGISKSTSSSTSSSTSETTSSSTTGSFEFGLTVGMEVGDPFGVATTSMQASMSVGASISSGSYIFQDICMNCDYDSF